MTYSPPAALAASLRRMSVPRPASAVATVTRPASPAAAMICASRALSRALSTSQAMPASHSAPASASLSSTVRVTTRQGCLRAPAAATSATICAI